MYTVKYTRLYYYFISLVADQIVVYVNVVPCVPATFVQSSLKHDEAVFAVRVMLT